MKYDVFISCKSEDYESAKLIYRYLCNCNYKVFLADIELRKKGNSEYGKVIDDALDSAEHLILFASRPEYITSSYVESEWRIFIEEKRAGRKCGNLISILDGMDVSMLPISLRHFQSFEMSKYTEITDYLPKKVSNTTSENLTNKLNNILSVDILTQNIYIDFKEQYSAKRSCDILNHIKSTIESIITDTKKHGQELKRSEFIASIRKCINDYIVQTKSDTPTLLLKIVERHCTSASEKIGGLIFSSHFSQEYNAIQTDPFETFSVLCVAGASIVSDSVIDEFNINQTDLDFIFATSISPVGITAIPFVFLPTIVSFGFAKIIKKLRGTITLDEVLKVYKKYDTDDTIVSKLKEKFEGIIDSNNYIKEQIAVIVKSYCDDCKQKLYKIGITLN